MLGVAPDGTLLGAMSQNANCRAPKRNIPIKRQPRAMKPALDSQIPKATPTSDMIIKARICHGRLPDIQPSFAKLESLKADG
jgi:hypothetical protein